MKKLRFLALSLLLFPVSVALAIPNPDQPTGTPSCLIGKDCPAGVKGVITEISDMLLMIVGALAVLFIIIGGVQYITSAGNPDNIGKAKNTILYGVIGLIVAILAYAVVKFVIGSF